MGEATAGVGIAPFRAFWMERSARAKVLGAGVLAPAVLFFGCRSKQADCLFHEARCPTYLLRFHFVAPSSFWLSSCMPA